MSDFAIGGHKSTDALRKCAASGEEAATFPPAPIHDGMIADVSDDAGQARTDTQPQSARVIAEIPAPHDGHWSSDPHRMDAVVSDDAGQCSTDALAQDARVIAEIPAIHDGHRDPDSQPPNAVVSDDAGQFGTDAQAQGARVIAKIQEQWRQRQDWHRAEKSLTLQIKAICRRKVEGDKAAAKLLYKAVLHLFKPPARREPAQHPHAAMTLLACGPLFGARVVIEGERAKIEKGLRVLAEPLPVADWWAAERGRDLLGLAAYVGEVGNSFAERGVASIWKYLGLAKCDPDIRKGAFSHSRRSVSWTIAGSLLKVQSAKVNEATGEVEREAGAYRKLYDERKAYEAAKNAAGDYADQAARILAKCIRLSPAQRKCLEAGKLTPKHLNARALLYMEKRLVKHLWQAWREAISDQLKPSGDMPLAELFEPGSDAGEPTATRCLIPSRIVPSAQSFESGSDAGEPAVIAPLVPVLGMPSAQSFEPVR